MKTDQLLFFVCKNLRARYAQKRNVMPKPMATKTFPYQGNGRAIVSYTSAPDTKVSLKNKFVLLELKLQASYSLIPLLSHLPST